MSAVELAATLYAMKLAGAALMIGGVGIWFAWILFGIWRDERRSKSGDG